MELNIYNELKHKENHKKKESMIESSLKLEEKAIKVV